MQFSLIILFLIFKGTAFGIMTAVQNLVLGIVPLINAKILTTYKSYDYIIKFFIAQSILAIILVFVFMYYNSLRKSMRNLLKLTL